MKGNPYFKLGSAQLQELAGDGDRGAAAEIQRREAKRARSNPKKNQPLPPAHKEKLLAGQRAWRERQKAAKGAKTKTVSDKRAAQIARGKRVMADAHARLKAQQGNCDFGQAVRDAWAAEKAKTTTRSNPRYRIFESTEEDEY